MTRKAGAGGKIRKRRRDRRGKLRGAIRVASAALAVAAVTQELRRPKSERTWHGRVANVPYDFRTPSPLRIKRSFWSPDDPRVIVPRAFGVGWSVNLAALVQQVKRARASSGGTALRD
jgi:hypothetical protein